MSSDATEFPFPVIDADDLHGFIAPVPPAAGTETHPVYIPTCLSRGMTPKLALHAYKSGAFPWPDQTTAETGLYPWGRLFPCTTIFTADIHLTHSFKKRLRDALAGHYEGQELSILLDADFDDFIETLAAYHEGRGGTWITDTYIDTWNELHRQGHAHCIGVYVNSELAGGLLFTSVGRMIYGESMMSLMSDGAKLALAALIGFCRVLGLPAIDCQMRTPLVEQFGAVTVSGQDFMTVNRLLSNSRMPPWDGLTELDLTLFMREAFSDLTPRPSPAQLPMNGPEERMVTAGGLLFPVIRCQEKCNYYDDGRPSLMQIALAGRDPVFTQNFYCRTIAEGYRRDSGILYTLDCPGCRRCIATRICLEGFRPDESMRRCDKANRHLVVRELPLAAVTDEQYALYMKYQHVRHPGGNMGRMSQDEVTRVLFTSCTDTRLLEIRDPDNADGTPGTLRMVCIIDVLADSISAVYTFYDPDAPARSLGTFGILSEIRWAVEHGLKYVYLGYWLPDYPGMNYKIRFQPLEIFWDNQWVPSETFSADPDILDTYGH